MRSTFTDRAISLNGVQLNVTVVLAETRRVYNKLYSGVRSGFSKLSFCFISSAPLFSVLAKQDIVLLTQECSWRQPPAKA